jgi:hypothetical protein
VEIHTGSELLCYSNFVWLVISLCIFFFSCHFLPFLYLSLDFKAFLVDVCGNAWRQHYACERMKRPKMHLKQDCENPLWPQPAK